MPTKICSTAGRNLQACKNKSVVPPSKQKKPRVKKPKAQLIKAVTPRVSTPKAASPPQLQATILPADLWKTLAPVKPVLTAQQQSRMRQIEGLLERMNRVRSMGMFLDEDQRYDLERELRNLKNM